MPPRVTRIDVDYTYPAGARPEAAHRERQRRHLRAGRHRRARPGVHRSPGRERARWRSATASRSRSPRTSPNELSRARLTVVDDNSYRVALADRDGMSNPGDTEYFIRTLEDRPPDVRILKPATDRSVTRLEEVDIEAQADDDYGDRPARSGLLGARRRREGRCRSTSRGAPRASTARHTLLLEDLERPAGRLRLVLRARARRDARHALERSAQRHLLPRGEAVRAGVRAGAEPGGMPGGGQSAIDDLVTAQKEIVVATWKLDRRAQSAKGASPSRTSTRCRAARPS